MCACIILTYSSCHFRLCLIIGFVPYFEIGQMIIEEEQHGQDRAAYGKQVLKALSDYLTKIHGKGFSPENLKLGMLSASPLSRAFLLSRML